MFNHIDKIKITTLMYFTAFILIAINLPAISNEEKTSRNITEEENNNQKEEHIKEKKKTLKRPIKTINKNDDLPLDIDSLFPKKLRENEKVD